MCEKAKRRQIPLNMAQEEFQKSQGNSSFLHCIMYNVTFQCQIANAMLVVLETLAPDPVA